MAAYHQATSSGSSSSSRPASAAAGHHGSHHPQLRLPLSHHGLPRGPTSPENSYSSRSQRYEPLSKNATAATPPLRQQDHHHHHPASSVRHSVSSTRRLSNAKPNDRYYSSDDEDFDDADYDDDDDDDDGYHSYPSSPAGPALSPPRTPGHFFRLSVASSTTKTDVDAPPSPPMTPFSPGAFPGAMMMGPKEDEDDEEPLARQCCPRCRSSLQAEQRQSPKPALPSLSTKSAVAAAAARLQTQQLAAGVQRARSMDEIPSPIRRMMSTRSVGGVGGGDGGGTKSTGAQEIDHGDGDDIIDPAVQRGYGNGGSAAKESVARPSSSSSSSFAVKFGKKIRQKLSAAGPSPNANADARPYSSSSRESGGGGGAVGRMRASSSAAAARVSASSSSSRKVEYEEMEDVHWSEI